MFFNWQPNLEMFTKLHFSKQIKILRLKIKIFLNFSYWINFYSPTKAPDFLNWCNRKNDVNFFENMLQTFSSPNHNSKIGFMTQHYVLENFHAHSKSLHPSPGH